MEVPEHEVSNRVRRAARVGTASGVRSALRRMDTPPLVMATTRHVHQAVLAEPAPLRARPERDTRAPSLRVLPSHERLIPQVGLRAGAPGRAEDAVVSTPAPERRLARSISRATHPGLRPVMANSPMLAFVLPEPEEVEDLPEAASAPLRRPRRRPTATLPTRGLRPSKTPSASARRSWLSSTSSTS